MTLRLHKTGIEFPDGSWQRTAGNGLPYRNLIINGDMRIAQRGTSATGVTTGYNTVDRFVLFGNHDGALTVSQSTDSPDEFSNSHKLEVTTADTSIGSSQYCQLGYKVEAQYLQSLAYGTSSAKTVTLSFWVKSNKTGTYCLCYSKDDTTRYDYIAEYTIDSANTWEKKIITIVPDSNIQASGGAIANDNGVGVTLKFVLATGSSRQGTNNTWNSTIPADATSNQVNWLDSISNTFYITGVQLEVGDTATPFEHRPYDVELARCQRYFESIGDGIRTFVMTGYGFSPTQTNGVLSYKNKRATPTISQYNASGASGEPFSYNNISGVSGDLNTFSPNTISLMSCAVNLTISSGTLASGNPANISLRSERGYYIHINSEL